MKNAIKKITNSVTPEQVQRMAKVEGLIYLKSDLGTDWKDAEEKLTELAERRRDICNDLGIDFTPFDTAVEQLLSAYEQMQAEAEAAKYVATEAVRAA